ncbi:MAG TPA: hypothetical protein VE640_02620, partial [Candidatus Bathyarchaeia archaeon]|nr:hypothetical protein [Candidatus Bathyarchaeia archaeon]
MIQGPRDRIEMPARLDGTPAGDPGSAVLPIEAASIFGALAAGVTVQDEQGRLVFANVIAALMSGYPSPDALLAAQPAELLDRLELIDGEGAPFDWDRLPGRRILAGEDPKPTLVGFRQ